LALNVHQRTARVPRIDGRVGLDEVLNVFNAAFRPVQATDASAGYREIEPEGISEGHYDITHMQAGGVAQRGGGQILTLDLYHRHVRLRVSPHHLPCERAGV
jgi:hypothetical protein